MRKLLLLLAFFAFVPICWGTEYRKVEAGDVADLFLCIAQYQELTRAYGMAFGMVGFYACSDSNRDRETACEKTDIGQKLMESKKELDKACTELTSEIVRKLQESGQIPRR